MHDASSLSWNTIPSFFFKGLATSLSFYRPKADIQKSTLISDIPNLEYPPSVLWEQPAFILTELITLKVGSTFPPLEFTQTCDYGGSVTTSLVKLGHKTSFSLLLLGYKFLNIATPSYNEAQAIHRQIHKDVNRAQLGFQPAACKLPVMWMNHLGSAS